ncbi:MAG: AarF/UbiB family protein [Thermomicrobiales bacterium]
MDFWLGLYAFIGTVVTIAIFAHVVRRLLGVEFSLARLAIAGAISLFVGQPILIGLAGEDITGNSTTFVALLILTLGVLISLLCGMVFLVIAEALVPSNTLPGPLYLWRELGRWLQRSRRYAQISAILVRRGLLAYVRGGRRAELRTSEGREAIAVSLREALSDGGVTFVKLGQILSTRRDLLPPEFIVELSKLQTQAPALPWAQIEPILIGEIGAEHLASAFRSIEREPLASASVAQVHAAVLADGREVVIKVRRPGIVTQVQRDLDIVERLARTLERNTGWGRRIGARKLADGFAVALREELDFRIEARNMAVVAAAAATRGGDPGLDIPTVYRDLTSAPILVMERIRGVPLGGAEAVIAERGLDTTELARNLLDSLLHEIVIDGTFHADPHPGNVMLLEDNRLTLLDFGSVGRIDAVLREALVRLLLAFSQRDPLSATDALLDLCERPDVLDEDRLERALGQFMARNLTPGIAPEARMFTDLLQIVADYGLSVPPEVAAVFRAAATLEGTLRRIDPAFDVIGEAQGFSRTYLHSQLRPDAIRKTLTDELTVLLPMLRRLPRRIDRITAALEDGRLSVNVRPLADERDRRVVGQMVHLVLLTVLASTVGVMSVIMIGREGGPRMTAAISVFDFIGYMLLAIASILALRVLVVIFRPVRD